MSGRPCKPDAVGNLGAGERDIEHEIQTYNALLGGDGEVGCTLLIEIEGEEKRAEMLRTLMGLPATLYARLEDGTRVRPTFDPAQVGDDRLSSVQYLRFDCGGRAPVALGADHPSYCAETMLSDAQRGALGEDLESAEAG